MANEAVIIPIIIDPKAGVAGLKAVGDQAQKTNTQIGGSTQGFGKFGDAMKGAAKNALAMFGAMNLAEGAVKFLVQGVMDAVTGTNQLASSERLLAKAQQEATESTREEVVQLQLLFNTAKDTNLSYSNRMAAIEKLNKLYPELHNNLTLEKIGNQEVALAVQSVIDKMVKKVQLSNTIAQIAKLTNELDRLKEQYNSFGDDTIISPVMQQGIDKLTERINTLTKSAMQLQAGEVGNIFDSVGKMFGGVKPITTPEIKIKPDKIKIEKPRDLSFAADVDFEALLNNMIKIPKKKYSMFIEGDTQTNENIGNDTTIDDIQAKADALLNTQMRMAEVVNGVVSPAFDSMFDAILDKQDALQAFFSTLGNSVKQLIKQLLAAAIQAAIISAITGGSANIGGVARKGFGQIFQGVMGFAEGGLVHGPVASVIGEGQGTNAYNPEVVSPLRDLQDMINNSLQNRMFDTGRMGISGSVISMPGEVKLRMAGREMVGLITLTQQDQRRAG